VFKIKKGGIGRPDVRLILLKRIFAAGAVLLLLGCGSDEEQLKIKRDIANLQEQIYQVERTQMEMKSELETRSDRLERKWTDQRSKANLQEEIQTIKARLAQYDALVLDLESKLSELSKTKTMVNLAPSDSQGDTPVEGANRVSGDVVEQQYRQAKLDYDRGKFKVAIIGFKDVIDNYPDSPYSEACYYYLGRSYYEENNFQSARDHFNKITQTYKNGDFVKQALLYEGRSFYHLNQPSNAIIRLRELIDTYPGTQEAVLAQKFLKDTGFEK